MTIAIAALAKGGQSATLVTDSMRRFPRADGRVDGTIYTNPNKILRSSRIAAVHSGCAPNEWPEITLPSDDFETAARELFGLVCSLRGDDVLTNYDPHHHLIVAGGPPGAPVSLAMLRTDEPPRFACEEGAVFVAGASGNSEWWERRRKFTGPPDSPEMAYALAISLACSFLDDHYQGAGRASLADFAAHGEVPCCAFPLHLLTVDPFGMHYTRIADERSNAA